MSKEINKKAYKNLTELRATNITEINEALQIVRQFIIRKKLILYGGMSIDLNLKKKGHKGIYTKNTLPDYDFLSVNNYADSIELANILHKRGFYNVGAVNAFHTTTRRVRFNFITVADISYCPQYLYEKLPTIIIDGIRVLHMDFQRIDLHVSLASLMKRFPDEEYINRYPKDLIRYNIIYLLFPTKKIKPVVTAPTYKNVLLNHFAPRTQCIKLPVDKGYYTGLAAYVIYYNYIKNAAKKIGAKLDMNQFMPVKCNKLTYTLPIDKVELLKPITTAPQKGIPYSKLLNIFPASIVLDNKIIYDSWGTMLSGVELKNKIRVMSAQYVLSQVLFKYLMTGYKVYLDVYDSINKMVSWAEVNYSDKYREFWRNSPLTINDNTISDFDYDDRRIYALKEASCAEQGINKTHRPIFGYYPAWKNIDKKIINFDTNVLHSYKIGGTKLDKFVVTNLNC